MSSKEITYTVTEQDLRAFYDAKGKIADTLWSHILPSWWNKNSNDGNIPPSDASRLLDIWNESVGPSFEFLLEGVKLRNGDEEE
tara:strand:+ start:235 stop:486 length:252 start_codon:yes stop_codon:yes gene_type:complete